MTDTMTSQNIDLSSWDTLYIFMLFWNVTLKKAQFNASGTYQPLKMKRLYFQDKLSYSLTSSILQKNTIFNVNVVDTSKLAQLPFSCTLSRTDFVNGNRLCFL
jgi:hypothetical protein